MQDISVIKGELITGTCIAVAAYLIHIGTRIYAEKEEKNNTSGDTEVLDARLMSHRY